MAINNHVILMSSCWLDVVGLLWGFRQDSKWWKLRFFWRNQSLKVFKLRRPQSPTPSKPKSPLFLKATSSPLPTTNNHQKSIKIYYTTKLFWTYFHYEFNCDAIDMQIGPRIEDKKSQMLLSMINREFLKGLMRNPLCKGWWVFNCVSGKVWWCLWNFWVCWWIIWVYL